MTKKNIEWLGGRLVEYFTRVGFFRDPSRWASSPRRARRPRHAVEEAETEQDSHASGRGQERSPPRSPRWSREARVLADFIPGGVVSFYGPLELTLEEATRALQATAGAAGTLGDRRRRPSRPPRVGRAASSRWSASSRWRSGSSPRPCSPPCARMSGQTRHAQPLREPWALASDNAVARLEQAASALLAYGRSRRWPGCSLEGAELRALQPLALTRAGQPSGGGFRVTAPSRVRN